MHLAIEFYQKAIEIKHDYHESYNNMGNVYAKLKECQKALEAYQKATKIKPDKYEAYYNMGFTYDLMENFDKAIENYYTAIEINPNIGKEINSKVLEFLTSRIETLEDPVIKQKYQQILNQLKDRQNKK